MAKKIKKLWRKHWNILPWFVCGIMVLIDGEISRFQYGLAWFCIMVMAWEFMPTEQCEDKNYGK